MYEKKRIYNTMFVTQMCVCVCAIGHSVIGRFDVLCPISPMMSVTCEAEIGNQHQLQHTSKKPSHHCLNNTFAWTQSCLFSILLFFSRSFLPSYCVLGNEENMFTIAELLLTWWREQRASAQLGRVLKEPREWDRKKNQQKLHRKAHPFSGALGKNQKMWWVVRSRLNFFVGVLRLMVSTRKNFQHPNNLFFSFRYLIYIYFFGFFDCMRSSVYSQIMFLAYTINMTMRKKEHPTPTHKKKQKLEEEGIQKQYMTAENGNNKSSHSFSIW